MPNNRLIKFYPILPRTKRPKKVRKARGGPTLVTSAITYNRVIKSTRTNLATGAVNAQYAVDTTAGTGQNNVKSGTSNPNWKIAVASGGNATSNYSRTIGTVEPIRYTGTTTGSGWFSQSHGSVIGAPLVNVLDNTALRDAAVGKLKHKLDGYIGNAQVAAPLAESREIHRLVRQINGLGLSVAKAASAIRKTKGKSALKQFGDIWLGFGFGVNPMLKDIESAANSILSYQTRQDSRVRVVGTASRDYLSSSTQVVGGIAFGTDMRIHSYGSHTQGVQIVAGVDLTIRSAASYSVEDHLGLKVSAIPSTLWELTPFSWAVDYFATVSPWLDDMFYTVPGTVKYVSQAAKYQIETTWLPSAVNSTNFNWSGSMSPGKFKYVSFARTSLATLPTRQLRFKTVDEIAKNGLTKLLNLTSVLAQKRGPRL